VRIRASRKTPIQRTPLSSIGHTHPVYSLAVLGTQNANNLVTVSTDGRMCVWAFESLHQPLEVLELRNKQVCAVCAVCGTVRLNSTLCYGGTCAEQVRDGWR
jgi:dynein intermediate chain